MAVITIGGPSKKGKPQAQGGGIFGSPKGPMPSPMDAGGVGHDEIRNISRRLKVLEGRYTSLRNKSTVTEQNMLSRNKMLSTEIKTTNSDLHELRSEINEIKDRIMLIIKELQDSAKKDEVKVLERYINLWEPVKFVTRKEVEEIVKDMIK